MKQDCVYRYCGRDFSDTELKWIARNSARRQAGWTRQAISRAVCKQLDWRKPDGGLKDMSARVALLRMHRDGLIELPPPTSSSNNLRKKPSTTLTHTDCSSALIELPTTLQQAQPLSHIWNSYIERYHYLGYSPLPGAQLRYLVRSTAGDPVALLGFGAAAWNTAPRDRLIGWSPQTRLPNLASHLLAHCQRRLPEDWQQRYAIRPVLLETFCEPPFTITPTFKVFILLTLGLFIFV